MALRVAVCRTDDVAPGEMNTFEVDGMDVPILVSNVGGQFRATVIGEVIYVDLM